MEVVDVQQWNFLEYLEITLVNIAVSQTWVAMVVWFYLTFTANSTILYASLSAIAGYFAGFIIRVPDIPWW